MLDLWTYFGLGNAAILTNACMLPLYPGLIAFLAGNANDERHRRASASLGLLVLAGILTMMIVIGALLYLLQQSLGAALTWVLPVIYALVILLGIAMLAGRSPFARLSVAQLPLARNPYIAAYTYGLLFGPMTLPCTGPIITSAFLLGAGDSAQLTSGLLNFVAFGLGFGWPLAILPLAALPLQRRFVTWLGRHHQLLERASGILLIAVGIFGILTELAPQIQPAFALSDEGWWVYWALVATAIFITGWVSLRRKML
jgi:cytochrome c-type biogenesis protein